jgi:chromosome segregation ATPase
MLAAGHKPYINGTCDFASLKAMYGCIWWLVRVCVLGDDVMFAPDTRVDDAHSSLVEQITMNERLTSALDEQRLHVEQSTTVIQNLTAENEELRAKVRELEQRGLSDKERITLFNRIEEKDNEIKSLKERLESMDKAYDQMSKSYSRQLCDAHLKVDAYERADLEHRVKRHKLHEKLELANDEIMFLRDRVKKAESAAKGNSAWEGDDCFALSDSDECSDE